MENSIVAAAALLSVCSGGLSEESTVHRTVALEGQTAVLPCTFTFTGTERLTIEWTKNEESLSPNFIFLFRSGREDYHMKNQLFWYRTHLFMDKLSKGDASLRISYVSLSDTGKYKCKTIQDSGRKESEVELFVGSASEPKFLQVSMVGEGVSLRCEATCWFPEPQMTLLNEQGKVINAENSTTERIKGTGCFTITGRSSVLSGGRFMCRVHQADINLTRDTEIYVPTESRVAYVKSSSPCSILVAVAVLPLVAVIICIVFRRRLAKCVSVRRRRRCWQRSGQNSEGQKYGNDVLTVEDDNSENEKLAKRLVTMDQSKTSVSDQSLSRSVPVVSNSSDGSPQQPLQENYSRPEPSNVLLCPKCFNYLPSVQKTESTYPVRRQNSAPGKIVYSTLARQTRLPSHDLDTEASPLIRNDDDDNLQKTE